MIRLDNISKQNGHQILFIEASMGIQKGEKVGLVGPKRFERPGSVCGLDDAIPLLLELIGQLGAQRLLILDDQNGARHT